MTERGDFPEIVTPRLRLRGWRDEDAEALARLNADPLVMRNMDRGPMTRDESDAQLERLAGTGRRTASASGPSRSA